MGSSLNAEFSELSPPLTDAFQQDGIMAQLNIILTLRLRNKSAFAFRIFKAGATTLLLLVSCLMYGCSRNPAPQTLAAQPSPAAAETKPAVAAQTAPALADVTEAVKRVFKDAATIDAKQDPSFLAGDFNGDASTDIAVALRPAPGKLAEMNQEFPPWILKDPLVAPRPGAPPLRIANDELLLAIIHGYGAKGWRDAEATQTYLLKNTAGLNARTVTRNELSSANEGKKLPRLVGDLISQDLRGKAVYLYFNGAQYSWYDPKTFRGEAETHVTHPGMTAKKNKFDLLHPKLVPPEK